MKARDLAVNKPVRAPVSASELRPVTFSDVIGQKAAVDQLALVCDAACTRSETAPHILIDGPPGLGKTTLAGAVASRMSGRLWASTGQSVGLEQLGKRLSTQPRGSLVFIDEIHTLSSAAEVMLLGAMEDNLIDLSTPLGHERREVLPFTLIGATTEPGSISRPLKDRFGHCVQLTWYPTDEIGEIITRAAEKLCMQIEPESVTEIAERSHGVPRIALGYLQRVRDYADVNRNPVVTVETVTQAFAFFDIDELGLSPRDREYVSVIYSRFRGGPVGGENLAVALGMDVRTVANDLEPLLMRLGLIGRAPRGRQLTDDGRRYARELLGELE